MSSVQKLIDQFGLVPHPEGGFYRQFYRASEWVPKSGLPERFPADRRFCTAVEFLLPQGGISRLHRIKSDEIWHFYLGGPLEIIEIHPDGRMSETLLGQDIEAGHVFHHVVPSGNWFGALCAPGTGFSFVGCTVSPGFEFEDFEMAKRSELLAQYPQCREAIERLTD